MFLFMTRLALSLMIVIDILQRIEVKLMAPTAPLQLISLTIPVWIYDFKHHRIYWANQPALSLWESDSLDELCSRDFKKMMSERLIENLYEFQAAFKRGECFSHQWHFSPKGIDKYALCQLSGYAIETDNMGMLVEALPTDKLNYDMQAGLATMLSEYTPDGRLISGNPPFLQAMGRHVESLDQIIQDGALLKSLYRGISQSGRFENDVLMQNTRGKYWYHIIAVSTTKGSNNGRILIHQNDIHKRKISEIALALEASSDALTGLLNRRGLEQRLEKLHEDQHPFTLYYIDLDGFKLINDSYGHITGDRILRNVAERLVTCLPKNSVICRFGGDEFIAAVPTNTLQPKTTQETHFASVLISTLAKCYEGNNHHAMSLSASIGVSQYPDHSDNIANIILYADVAMYEAKHRGKNRWVEYKQGMAQNAQRQSLLSQHLYYAIKKEELSLHYQPIWDFSNDKNGRITSFEALLRWHNSELGWVSPEEAVKVAEEIGIIDNIECWVAQQALTDLITLRQLVAPTAGIAVNVSSVHLLDPTLPSYLLQLLNDKGLCPQDLTVELTEGALIEDIDKENSTVRQLVKHGIKVNIDDFGTGYSSLAYLHHIPATMVKIDRFFVQHLE